VAEKPRECRARVASVRELTPDVLEATLQMEEPPELSFEAGQWVSIPFGPKTVRAYSIASAPSSRQAITLAADVAPAGLGSRWFRSLARDDEVRFKGPLGGFVLPRSDAREPLFVAEEIGIVPIRSILMDLAESDRLRSARLVFWARTPHGLVYEDEFRALARRHSSFAYHPLVGAGDHDWPGPVGALDELVDRLTQSVENLVVYVAGGEQTIHQVRDLLVAKGLERKAVKWEKFW
jgi:phenol hydroxylase P5 protein